MEEREYWDLYYPDGRRAGKTVSSDQPIPEGFVTKLVHVFICDGDGRFLLQKRSMKKRYFPGIWDSTGGRVQAGETGPEAIAREVFEEVGLRAKPEDFHFLSRVKLPWPNLFEMYALKLDFELADCTMQEDEVDELKLLPYREAREVFLAMKKDACYLEGFRAAARLFGLPDA